MPFADCFAAHLTEASAKSATYSPRPGIAHGCIRKTYYLQALPWHGSRNVPKDMPLADCSVALYTELSVRITTFFPFLWSNIRKVPKDMPSLRLSAVEHTEVSVKTTVNGTLCGIVYGTIRKLCRITPSQRHSLRKNPKDMLLSGHGTAPFTDASERTATVAPVYGQTYGTIREICHLPTAQWHCSRSLPKERPSVDPPAARLTDASAKTTARRRASADPRAGARCRRES